VVSLPGQQEPGAGVDIRLFAELCGDGDAAVFAEVDVDGGFHEVSTR
jgi:hypothetical protein